VSSLYHCAWSTKDRKQFISADLEQRLWPFMGGIARKRRFHALGVGGVPDHGHLLLSLPSNFDIAKAVQLSP
jgi:putative transposase